MAQNILQVMVDIKSKRPEQESLTVSTDLTIDVYPASIEWYQGICFFIGKIEDEKFLFLISTNQTQIFDTFHSGTSLKNEFGDTVVLMQYPMIYPNAVKIRELFSHTRPGLIGLENSFGLGDRIGLANPGHLRAVRNSGFRAILAQQSIRELNRTNRTPEEVMDAATWAVFQEGYTDGFGADADHLITTADIDLMANAGFTMFTVDPSDYVVNEAATLSESDLTKRSNDVSWDVLQDTIENVVERYRGKTLSIDPTFSLTPTHTEVLQAIVKYGNVIAHVVKMHNHLITTYPKHPSELEVSVDETDSPTTLFEHYFIVNELKRLGVKLVSLAPRFIGDFEKGIDYRGDINAFAEEYKKHVAIAGKLGPYKMSIHSGSDKFTVYQAIGRIGRGSVHVKTAGTSYLEALRVVAVKEPDLFRSILTFSRDNFTKEKQTYHVSGELEKVPAADSLNDEQLVQLFDSDDARQVLHVAFGKTLTIKDDSGASVFKDKLLTCLKTHEQLHYQFIETHFRKHIEPFKIEAEA